MGGCTNKAVKIVASEQFDLRKPGRRKGHPKVGRRVEVKYSRYHTPTAQLGTHTLGPIFDYLAPQLASDKTLDLLIDARALRQPHPWSGSLVMADSSLV